MRILSGVRAAVGAVEAAVARVTSRPRSEETEATTVEVAGRIPRAERHLASPTELIFVDRYGEAIPVPDARALRADGYYAYARDGAYQLTRETAAAFRAMREEALAAGYNLRLNDGFRPDTEQAARRARAATEDADRRVAPAGASEHRTGRAIDVGTEMAMPDGTRARRGLAWVIENAARFGFNHYDGPPGERMHFSYNVK